MRASTAIATAQKRAAAWQSGTSGADGAQETTGAQATAVDPAPAGAATSDSDAGPPPPRAIREAQTLLGALGYRPGPADGIWGRRTGAAYQAFLRDAGLPAADTLTPEALRAMRAIVKRETGGVETGSVPVGARDAAQSPSKQSPPRGSAVRPDALHRAAQAGDIDGLKTALDAGVAVDARDGRGWTALMHAADKGYTLLVEPLLAAKADPDVRAPDGATALFMAAAHGHTEIVALLMKAGADASIAGPKGKTAADLARLNQNLGVAAAMGVRRVFRDCSDCPEMVVVPAGRFRMGSPESERERNSDEGPVHEVTIGEPIAVGVYEVTFEGWDACVRAGACSHAPDDRGWGRGNRPVINVSWGDAQEYVRWLSRETGERYRLLSESEWEYVARAGTETRYWWGDSIGRNQANCNGCGSRWDNEGTAPAGSFAANRFGLHDVHGNVWEWVEDCWHGDYRGAPTDGSAWTRGGDCSRRVLRGGSWHNPPWILRSAYRYGNSTAFRYDFYGFRVARTLTP